MDTLHLPRLGACAGLLALAVIARAATVTVVVIGADHQPAPDVVVQLMPAHPAPIRLSSEPVVIAQRDIRFVPYLTAVPVGTTVRFSNQDPYDHHLRSEPAGPMGNIAPAKEFETRLAAASGDKVASTDIKFDKSGVVVLGCHLHSSMRGHLFISETPYVAVTDVDGRVVINDVPEGSVDLRAWSPDQLIEQAATPQQVRGPTTSFNTTLNFSPAKPRRRRH